MYVNLIGKIITDISNGSTGKATRLERENVVGIEWYTGANKGGFSFINITELNNLQKYEISGCHNI